MGCLKFFLAVLNLVMVGGGVALVYFGYNEKESIEIYFNIYYTSLPLTIMCIPYIIMALGLWVALVCWFGLYIYCMSEELSKMIVHAHCIEAAFAVTVALIILLFTNFLPNAGISFVEQNFDSEIYDISYMELMVVFFLVVTAKRIRMILIYSAIAELILLVCSWPRRRYVRAKVLEQMIARRQQNMTIIAIPTNVQHQP